MQKRAEDSKKTHTLKTWAMHISECVNAMGSELKPSFLTRLFCNHASTLLTCTWNACSRSSSMTLSAPLATRKSRTVSDWQAPWVIENHNTRLTSIIVLHRNSNHYCNIFYKIYSIPTNFLTRLLKRLPPLSGVKTENPALQYFITITTILEKQTKLQILKKQDRKNIGVPSTL